MNTAAAVTGCEEPEVPAGAGQHQQLHTFCAAMEAILRDENLEHLLPTLARRDVRELQSLLAANRVAFLA